ncbi:MAG: hypothetical protein SVU32_01465 [Candidatus Nanohaloarchaea archaeon]|nr:hypothetical protein [Candidatus Nanohaloarchaea archaeon]
MNRVLTGVIILLLLTPLAAAVEPTDYVWSTDPSSGNVADGFCYPAADPGEDIDCNAIPVIDNREPKDGVTVETSSPTLSVRVDDPEGKNVTVNFTNTATGTELHQEEVFSGSTVTYEWTGLQETQQYSWKVNATDGAWITGSKEWTFTVGIPPSITCNGCSNVSQAEVGQAIRFSPTITDDTSFTAKICSTQYCNETVFCTFQSGEGGCSTSVGLDWTTVQPYWIHAEDAHGYNQTVKGGTLTIQTEAVKMNESIIVLSMGESITRDITISNSDNARYTYRITTSAGDSNLLDIVIEGAEPTGKQGETFTVGPESVRTLPMIVRASYCIKSTCSTTLTVSIKNQQTGATYSTQIQIRVVREGAGFSGPGLQLLQIIVLALAAGIYIIARR